MFDSDSFVTPWTVGHQASPPSIGFPRQVYWSSLPFPSPGDFPDPGTELVAPLAGRFLLLSHQGSQYIRYILIHINAAIGPD